MDPSAIYSGIQALDKVLQGIRLGDNVVWQVDGLEDYRYFVEPFAEASIADRRRLVYLRFASHPPVLAPRPGLETIGLNPGFNRPLNCSSMAPVYTFLLYKTSHKKSLTSIRIYIK